MSKVNRWHPSWEGKPATSQCTDSSRTTITEERKMADNNGIARTAGVLTRAQVRKRLAVVDAYTLNVSQPFEGQARITPEDAKVWLEINVGNRRLRNQFVKYLVRCILNGEWQEDHPQPIVFSDAGRLIDGQHRLESIIASNTTVIAKIVCGARDELREYLDTGISRTLEDRVEFDENLNTNRHIATVVSSYFMQVKSEGRNKFRMTPSEAMEIFQLHESAIRFAARFMARNQRGICRAPVAAALVVMYEKNPKIAEAFAESLTSPDGNIQPSRHLREYCLSNPAGGHMAARDAYAKSVAAMKAALEGRELKILRGAIW